MNQERSRDLEKTKWRVLSHIFEGALLPPREALNNVAGQKAIVALERLHKDIYPVERDGVVLKTASLTK